MARKTLQVDEVVHERFSKQWKKIDWYSYDCDYAKDSASAVLTVLMDFYEKHNSEEMKIALDLVMLTSKKLNK